MDDRELIETTALAILTAQDTLAFATDSEWEDFCLDYWLAHKRGDLLAIPEVEREAFTLAEAVASAIRPVPKANPEITFDWKQKSDREWKAEIAEGWSALVRQALGDGTWSFIVNQSGRCYLDSRETAIRLAEEDARRRIAVDIREAARTSRAFGLGLPIEARGDAA
jgi:hypothetical protein